MKSVEKRIKAAFEAGRNLTVGNTRTDGKAVYLFGNLIILKTEAGEVLFTLAGWNTVTTRSRVNAIVGAGVYVKRGEPHRNGEPIESNKLYLV